MFKVIVIGALLAILIFFIIRRLGLGFQGGTTTSYIQSSEWLELRLDNATLKRAVKQTLLSVGIGFILLVLILLVASKFRIALLLLPISFYLIGQYFILMNHIKASRKLQIFFHRNLNEIKVYTPGKTSVHYRLDEEMVQLKEIKGVQKNQGLLFGYYAVRIGRSTFNIPYLLEENKQNKPFFHYLQPMSREIETKLFPII